MRSEACLLPYTYASHHKRDCINDSNSDYKHDASDKKLDHAADAANTEEKSVAAKHGAGPSHDPAKIARHDDAGKDRLFEHREQHDDGEKESERTRVAKDVAKHDHPVDDAAKGG